MSYFSSPLSPMTVPQSIGTIGTPKNVNTQPSISLGVASNGTPAVTTSGSSNMSLGSTLINTNSNYSVTFNNTSTEIKGSIRFDTARGNMEVHDGDEWVIMCGLDSDQSKSQKIINALLADYPEIAADLVLRGIID